MSPHFSDELRHGTGKTFLDFSADITEFQFQVGVNELHTVGFRFNQSVGNLRISVDDVPIMRRFAMFSISTRKKYSFEVGNTEKHQVTIERVRQRIFGGLLPQKYIVSVDDQLLQEL